MIISISCVSLSTIVFWGIQFKAEMWQFFEKWLNKCFTAKECGGVHTDQEKILQSPGFPDEYPNEQICYWHIRVRYGQKIRLQFLEFDVEDDVGCISDYLEIYDSYDDVSGFAGRYEGVYKSFVYEILQSLTCVLFAGTVGMNYPKTFLAQVYILPCYHLYSILPSSKLLLSFVFKNAFKG